MFSWNLHTFIYVTCSTSQWPLRIGKNIHFRQRLLITPTQALILHLCRYCVPLPSVDSLELSKKTGGGGLCLVSICFWKKNSRFGLNKAETCLSCRAVTGAIQQKKSNSRIFTGLFLPEFSHSCACHMLCDTSDLCWLTNGKTLSLHFFNAFFPFFGKKCHCRTYTF